MELWTERGDRDSKRLRVAAEHSGVSAFADIGARDALRLVSGLVCALAAAGKYRRYRNAVRRKQRRRCRRW